MEKNIIVSKAGIEVIRYACKVSVGRKNYAIGYINNEDIEAFFGLEDVPEKYHYAVTKAVRALYKDTATHVIGGIYV